MKVGLVTPLRRPGFVNPGSLFITAGIEAIIAATVPDVQFVHINMIADDATWEQAPTCDAVILCGNPRIALNPTNQWHDLPEGMWARLANLPRVIDAWSGACYPHNARKPIDFMVGQILSVPGNRERLELSRPFIGRIARDPLMQALYESLEMPSVLLPCSSAWAANRYGVVPSATKTGKAIVALALRNHRWLARQLQHLSLRSGYDLIATTQGDLQWLLEHGISVRLTPVFDERDLLLLYAGCEHVLSFRIHAAIPAASLGCGVSLVEIDSRALTCRPFNIPTMTMEEFASLGTIDGVPPGPAIPAVPTIFAELLR